MHNCIFIGTNSTTMVNVCQFCNAKFTNKQNLERHVTKKTCNPNPFPFPLKLSDTNAVGLAVFRAVDSHELKFHVCQNFGLAKEKFFPLNFAPQRKRAPRAEQLNNFLPSNEGSATTFRGRKPIV